MIDHNKWIISDQKIEQRRVTTSQNSKNETDFSQRIEKMRRWETISGSHHQIIKIVNIKEKCTINNDRDISQC